MKTTTVLSRFLTSTLLASMFLLPSTVKAVSMSEKEATALAADAYVYAYPLVTMEYTRRALTNVSKASAISAPMGQLVNLREYPKPEFKSVTAPNADTLYTSMWLDVSKEAWVLSLPDMKDRYVLFPLLNAWTDVFQSPGTRTTGTKAQKYLITGPGWKGTVPQGVKQYKSATALVWMIGRIYCTGTPEDYAAVHKLQDQISIVPLSAYGKAYTPPLGEVNPDWESKKPTRDRVNELDGPAYFKLFAALLKTNPPLAADKAMVAKLAKMGIVPGKDFDIAKLDPVMAAAVAQAPKVGQEKIQAWFKGAVASGDAKTENGWNFFTKVGVYGTDYLQRALIAWYGLGANRIQDAVYPTSELNAENQPYNGANKYILHFPKGQLPPVRGFWSITMYDKDYFFIENPINRNSISPRQSLKSNADGSIDIYIQNESPGADKESNWLPAPKDRFVLMTRMYWPKETSPSIINGTWSVPAVKQVK